MDGTLADHNASLDRDMELIRAPEEPVYKTVQGDDNEPAYLKERKRLIRSQRDWWFNLNRMPLGFDVYELAKQIGFQNYVLTKGPWTCPYAWTEKLLWCRKHLDPDVKITVTEDKQFTYGRVLVDDWEPYVKDWLLFRPRGLVVMPLNEGNANVRHPQIVLYDGTNLAEVRERMEYAFNRN
jgi:hypothetical protein